MVSVVIPTYNAAAFLPKLLQSLNQQTLPHEVIIIDSGSTDGTQEIVVRSNALLVPINKSEFNHGTTRNYGLHIAQSDIVVFMTQDALPASEYSLEHLVNMLRSRENIAMAYGRQLPYPEAGVFGRLARLTNYPDTSLIKTKQLIPEMGIKTCSCSNSFAVYYKEKLLSVGGFPSDTILGEDVSVAARFILNGDAVAYSAEAQVYHSHDYSLSEEFKRYFDIGVFHKEQEVVLREFSQAESEGIKYVVQEWNYLAQNGHLKLVPEQLLRTIAKYLGYRLGNWEKKLPASIKRKISMHKSFWI